MYISAKDQARYIEKLNELWVAKYPEHKHLAANTLSDKARRLPKLQKNPIKKIHVITETVQKTQNVVDVEIVLEQLKPAIEQMNTEKELNRDSNQEKLNELEEKKRNIFKTRLQIIEEGNIEKSPLPETVLTKFGELAADAILKEEAYKKICYND